MSQASVRPPQTDRQAPVSTDFPSLVPDRMPGIPDWLLRAGAGAFANWLHVPVAERLLADLRHCSGAAEFCAAALQRLDVGVRVERGDGAAVPSDGPVLAISNHPFGALDSFALGRWLGAQRPDWRYVGLSLWGRIPPLQHALFAVESDDGVSLAHRHGAVLRRAMRWLRDGHALGLFPAGSVSHWQWRTRRVEDPPWTSAVGLLAQRTGARVLPLYVHGRNSLRFQLVAALHPRLRHPLLMRELFARAHQRIRLTVGAPIESGAWHAAATPAEVTRLLRQRVYALAETAPGDAASGTGRRRPKSLRNRGNQ